MRLCHATCCTGSLPCCTDVQAPRPAQVPLTPPLTPETPLSCSVETQRLLKCILTRQVRSGPTGSTSGRGRAWRLWRRGCGAPGQGPCIPAVQPVTDCGTGIVYTPGPPAHLQVTPPRALSPPHANIRTCTRLTRGVARPSRRRSTTCRRPTASCTTSYTTTGGGPLRMGAGQGSAVLWKSADVGLGASGCGDMHAPICQRPPDCRRPVSARLSTRLQWTPPWTPMTGWWVRLEDAAGRRWPPRPVCCIDLPGSPGDREYYRMRPSPMNR